MAFEEFAEEVGYPWAWNNLGRDWEGTRAFFHIPTSDMFIRRGPFEEGPSSPGTPGNWPADPLKLPGDGDLVAERNEIRFNSCKGFISEGGIVDATAFGTLVHEAGHPLGISGAPHPEVAGSTLNYLSEPDCSPHPLDIMAIYSMHQTR